MGSTVAPRGDWKNRSHAGVGWAALAAAIVLVVLVCVVLSGTGSGDDYDAAATPDGVREDVDLLLRPHDGMPGAAT